MAEQDELLQEVLNNPDDDAPRLTYAHWCEQQSDEPTKARSELIRVQIAIALMDTRAVNQGAASDLEHRERALIDSYGPAWAGPVAALVDQYAFDRGFLEIVTLSARAFLEHAAQFFALAPIRHLNLTHVTGVADALFSSPYLRRIRSLVMDRCDLYDVHFQLLAASPEVEDLRWLSVADNHMRMPGAEALATSAHLKQLAFANFLGNPVDPGEWYGQDGGAIMSSALPAEGKLLESRHGHLPWLHRYGETVVDYYPDRRRM